MLDGIQHSSSGSRQLPTDGNFSLYRTLLDQMTMLKGSVSDPKYSNNPHRSNLLSS